MIEIIDNFLPDNIFSRLEFHLEGMSWMYDSTNNYEKSKSFGHSVNKEYGLDFQNNTERGMRKEFSFIMGSFVAEKFGLAPDSLFRVRYGLITREEKHYIHASHTDYPTPHYTALLYAHDSDGDTYFYEQDGKTIIQTVSPKRNRLVFFDGLIPHSSSTPINNPIRTAVNFNFSKENT